jgi:hypothetical protein
MSRIDKHRVCLWFLTQYRSYGADTRKMILFTSGVTVVKTFSPTGATDPFRSRCLNNWRQFSTIRGVYNYRTLITLYECISYYVTRNSTLFSAPIITTKCGIFVTLHVLYKAGNDMTQEAAWNNNCSWQCQMQILTKYLFTLNRLNTHRNKDTLHPYSLFCLLEQCFFIFVLFSFEFMKRRHYQDHMCTLCALYKTWSGSYVEPSTFFKHTGYLAYIK